MSWAERLQKNLGEPTRARIQSPRKQLNELLSEAIRIALQLVEKHGNHVPFCLVITINGELTNIVADDTEVKDRDVLFESVRQRVLEQIHARQLQAVAFAKNMRFHLENNSASKEAIQITLDHLQDSGCICYLPYEIVGGRVVPGEPIATTLEQQIFTDKATFVANSNGQAQER